MGDGGWFGGLLSSVKNSLAHVSEDLKEFVDTITGDTSATINSTVEAIKERQSTENVHGLSVASTAVSEVVSVLKSTIAEPGRPRTRGSARENAPVVSKEEAELDAIRHRRETYTRDPADAAAFRQWCGTFDLHARTEAMSQLLSADAAVRRLHAELIPLHVSYNLFWQRYFYQLHLIEASRQHRLELVRKMATATTDHVDFDDWDDDEEADQRDSRSAAAAAASEPAPPPAAAATSWDADWEEPRASKAAQAALVQLAGSGALPSAAALSPTPTPSTIATPLTTAAPSTAASAAPAAAPAARPARFGERLARSREASSAAAAANAAEPSAPATPTRTGSAARLPAASAASPLPAAVTVSGHDAASSATGARAAAFTEEGSAPQEPVSTNASAATPAASVSTAAVVPPVSPPRTSALSVELSAESKSAALPSTASPQATPAKAAPVRGLPAAESIVPPSVSVKQDEPTAKIGAPDSEPSSPTTPRRVLAASPPGPGHARKESDADALPRSPSSPSPASPQRGEATPTGRRPDADLSDDDQLPPSHQNTRTNIFAATMLPPALARANPPQASDDAMDGLVSPALTTIVHSGEEGWGSQAEPDSDASPSAAAATLPRQTAALPASDSPQRGSASDVASSDEHAADGQARPLPNAPILSSASMSVKSQSGSETESFDLLDGSKKGTSPETAEDDWGAWD